jgi:acyl carrier protein
MTVREFVLNALQREYPFKPGVDTDSIDYIREGYMSSLSVIQFIAEIEDEFGIEFTEEELRGPDFPVVGRLIGLVERKAGTAGWDT